MTRAEVLAQAEAVPGFMKPAELAWLYDHARGRVVEVGSFLGRSTVALGQGVRARGGELHVVDVWSPDFRSDKVPEGLSPREAFDRAMAEADLAPRVWAMPHEEAAAHFEDGSVDLVFYDASHGDTGAWLDLWAPKVRPGGLLSGHNYGNGGDVKEVVDARYPEATVVECLWSVAL